MRPRHFEILAISMQFGISMPTATCSASKFFELWADWNFISLSSSLIRFRQEAVETRLHGSHRRRLEVADALAKAQASEKARTRDGSIILIELNFQNSEESFSYQVLKQILLLRSRKFLRI